MDENQHPKGALLFMIVYLLLLAGLWLNVYLALVRDDAARHHDLPV